MNPQASVHRRPYAPAARSGLGVQVVIGLGALLLALVFGLLATTANPVLVAMAVAMVVGALLFAKPTWTMWLMVSLGLLVAGLLPIWAEGFGRRAAWGVSILGFVLLIHAFFRAATSRGATRHTPAFVWLALAFLVYALVVSVLQRSPPDELLGGFKRYFQAFGLLFALAWLGIEAKQVVRLRKLLLIVAVVQLPFALYELIKLVPFRRAVAAAYPGMVPIDVVAGTFGAQLYAGGANAEMATFLVLVLAFLAARYREGLLSLGRLMLLIPFVVAPLFLGETKIVVVLVPLVFAVLYKRELLARPHIALVGLLVGAGMTVAAVFAYSSIMGKTPQDLLETTLFYNVGDHGYGRAYLNRTSVLTHWADSQSLAEPVSAVLGNGLGASHQATAGHIAERYPGYYIGLTAASTLLWDMGGLGTLLFLAILATAWRAAGRLRRWSTDPSVRADAAGIQCAVLAFTVYLIYRLALLETLSFQIVFALVLGHLAWLYRRHMQAAEVASA